MKNTHSILASAILVTLLFTSISCEKNKGADNPYSGRNLPELTKQSLDQIKGGIDDFTFTVFKKAMDTRKDDTQLSPVFSPYSLATALAMAEGGAKGRTSEQMKNVLGFSQNTQEEIAKYFYDINQVLTNAKTDVIIKNANSIWADAGCALKDDYKLFTEYYYGAKIGTAEFQSRADLINNWCKENTNGRIKEIVSPDELASQNALFLFNALYFASKWTVEFNSSSGYFNNYSKKKVTTSMIQRTSDEQKTAYADNVSMIEIPYCNDSFVFDMLIPDAGTDIFNVINDLTPTKWNGLISQLETETLNLSIPAIEADEVFSFTDILKSMGMTDAFGEGATANFSGLFVSREPEIKVVRQKTFFFLTNSGTEAGSATTIGMSDKGAKEFIVDRPFIFAIRERSTNIILFMGAVLNSKSNSIGDVDMV